MTTETFKRSQGEKIGLSLHQRAILQYYYNHISKYPDEPCYAPRISLCAGRKDIYDNAMAALERMKYITVDRSAPNYRRWIIKATDTAPRLTKTSVFT